MLEAISKFPIFGPIVSVWLQIAFLVVSAVLDSEVRSGAGNGEAKKQAAIAKIKADIDNPGGPDWPSWLPVATQSLLIGGILELFILVANKTGFLSPSKPG